jgi:hypothetical protein
MISKTSNLGLICGLFFALVLVSPVSAQGPVIRSGESVSVEASQVLEGDFYAFGQDIVISGSAERDIYSLGGSVTINGPVGEDLTVIGANVQVHGKVEDDIRVMGGKVTIAEPVTDDLVVIAESVHILSTASVGGDFIFFGSEVTIDGPVIGAVYGTAGNIRIDARVGGDVSVRTGQSFTLGDKADVGGGITYQSPFELTRGQNAVVSGTITRDDIVHADEGGGAQELIIFLLVLIFSGLTIFFILRTKTGHFIQSVTDGYGRLGLIGLGMLLALPIVAVILMASVVGSLVGLTLFLAYFLMIFGALMSLPVLFGAFFQRLIRLGNTITVFTIILGVFVLIGLLFIPLLGGFMLFLGFLVTVGYMCTELYRIIKSL